MSLKEILNEIELLLKLSSNPKLVITEIEIIDSDGNRIIVK